MTDEPDVLDDQPIEVDEAALAEVQEVVGKLTNTSKVFRTYPRTNTISIAAIDALSHAFEQYLSRHEELELFVERHELQWQGVAVYSETDPRRSFALKLDRDGVRRMTFTPGITRDEVVNLLEALTKEIDENSLDDDVVTLLWEKQLEHVKVFVLDDLASGEAGYDQGLQGAGELKGTDAAEEGGSMSSKSQDSPRPAITEQGGVDPEVLPSVCSATRAKMRPLTDEQSVALTTRVQAEESHEVSEELTGILFDILRSETQSEVYVNACKVLIELSVMHIKNASFGTAAGILGAMRAMAADDTVNKDARTHATEQLQALAEPSRMECIGSALRTRDDVSLPDLSRFLTTLPAAAAVGLCDLLDIERYAEVLCGGIRHLVKDDPTILAPRITGANAALAGKLFGIIETVADEKLVQMLAPALLAGDDSVKMASVRLLEKAKGSAARDVLMNYVASSNAGLRKSALKAMGTFAGDPAPAAPLRAEVAARDFDERSLEEKKMFLATLAKLEGRGAVEFLERIVADRRWFEKSCHSETRACAALALGEIDDERAHEALERNMADRAESVSTAVRMVLGRRRHPTPVGR